MAEAPGSISKLKPDRVVSEGSQKRRACKDRRHDNPHKNHQSSREPKFEGELPILKDHVYSALGKSAPAQYATTSEAIARYVGTHFNKHGADIRKAVESTQHQVFTAPAEPTDNSIMATSNYKIDNKDYRECLSDYTRNVNKLFSLLEGQSLQGIKTKVASMERYPEAKGNLDGILLLALIRDVMLNLRSKAFPAVVAYQQNAAIYSMRQQPHQSCQDFLKLFKGKLKMLESIEANFGADSRCWTIAKADAGYFPQQNLTPQQGLDVGEAARELYRATTFLGGIDKARYGKLIEELSNSYLKGSDDYPRTMDSAFTLVSHYQHNRIFTN